MLYGRRHGSLVSLSGIQYINPLQHLTQIAVVRARVTDDGSPQRSRDAWAKLQPTPTQRRQLVRQARPAHARTRYQERCIIPLILDGVTIQSYTHYNTPHTPVAIQDICPIATQQ